MDKVTYALSKKYTDKSIEGMGAIKGKNATINRISKDGKINDVDFQWTSDTGRVQHTHMYVEDGNDGESAIISDATAVIGSSVGGTPSVQVILDGTPLNRSFGFIFDNLVGSDGKDGKGIKSIIIPDPTQTKIQIVYDDDTLSDLIDIPTVDGISPSVTVKSSTDTEYVLEIKDADGTIVTPNLRGKDGSEAIPVPDEDVQEAINNLDDL